MRNEDERSIGQSTVELVAGLVILVPIILFLIDISIIVTAGFKNDSICREACRAAASGKPDDRLPLARQQVQKNNQSGSFAKFELEGSPELENFVEPASGQGLCSGTIKVRTKARIHAPFLIGFFSPTVDMVAEQAFPYTYMKVKAAEK